MARSSFQNLLVGEKHLDSKTEFKYAILRGQLGFLLGMICLIYIPIDVINGVYIFIPWYIMGLVSSFLVILFNRSNRHILCTVFLLLFSNILVYIFAAVDHPASGVSFFFMATASMGLILFYPINKYLGYAFVFLSIALALLAYLADYSPLPPPLQTPTHISINFTINLTLGMVASTLIVLFIMNRNEDSETTLLNNQKELQSLANELQVSRERFQLAVEGTNAGIYEWNIQNNSIYTSPQWRKLLGYDNDSSIDTSLEFFLSLVHPEDAKETSKSVNTALQEGSSYQNELRMKRKDGSWRWFQDSGIIKHIDNKPFIGVGSIIDIEDRKIAEQQLLDKNQQLEKINQELDRFVYSASHDMRAPLSTLLGLLQLARMTQDPKELLNYFDLMTNRIYTMEGFIKEVTDYSRNARLEIEVAEFKLLDLVNEVVELFSFLADDSDVEVIVEVDEKLILNTDEIRLKVILNNLLSNAIKYHDPSKEKRSVRIVSEFVKGECTIKIQDNGLGIPEKYLSKIFDMFYRASEISGGSGLGLYIVKETLDRLNGTIKCESVASEGTTFEVSFPIDK